MTLREVVDVCIDRSGETVVAVAQGGHVDEVAAVMELAEFVRVGLPHDGLDRVAVHKVHAEKLKAAVLQELLERELGIVRDVVAEQLVVAVVAEDVLEARDGDEAEGLRLQVVPYVPEHVARIRLMLEEVELHEGVKRALRVAHVAGREALVDAIRRCRDAGCCLRCRWRSGCRGRGVGLGGRCVPSNRRACSMHGSVRRR